METQHSEAEKVCAEDTGKVNRVSDALEIAKIFIQGMEEGRFKIQHVGVIRDDLEFLRDRIDSIRKKFPSTNISFGAKVEELFTELKRIERS